MNKGVGILAWFVLGLLIPGGSLIAEKEGAMTPEEWESRLDDLLGPVTEAPGSGPVAVEESMNSPVVEEEKAPAVRRLEGDAVLAMLKAALQTKLGEVGDLRLQFVSPWEPLVLGRDDPELVLEKVPPGALSSPAFLTFSLVLGEGRVERYRRAISVQDWRQAWVAQRNIVRGEVLDPAWFEQQWVDIMDLPYGLVDGGESLPEGLETVRAVSAGRPLGWQFVRKIPLIRKGDVVPVVASEGMLSISLKAVALEDGATGETIRLRNQETRREFAGQVMGERYVEVSF